MNFRAIKSFNRINTVVVKRMMSGHSAEEAKAETQKWVKITMGKKLLYIYI